MFKQMKLGTKLIAGFCIVAVVALFLGGIGYYGAVQNDRAMDEVGAVRLPSIQSVLEMKESMQAIILNLRTLLNPDLEKAVRKQQYEQINELRGKYKAAFDIYEPLPQTAEESRQWDQFMEIIPKWAAVNDEIFELHQQIDSLDILNPEKLLVQLQKFRGDHYALEVKVANMLLTGNTFSGGDDGTKCPCGQWLAGFSTQNSELQRIAKAIDRPHRQFHAAVGDIRRAVKNEDQQEAIRIFTGQMQDASIEMFDSFDELIAEAQKAAQLRTEIAEKTMGEGLEYMEAGFGRLNKVIAINEEIAEKEVSGAISQSGALKTLNLFAMIAGVILALGLGLLLTRSISAPIRRIVDGLSTGAGQVSSASSQVASSSQSQAEGASEQASSLEQTSSSLEEMAAQTKQNADNADQADNAVRETAQVVDKGVASMEKMNDAINEIKESASETSKIIKTIDDIAFQTNLLALNAAVEAARAGEAGKGFAVVAEEVRNLAQRSAEAAQNTSELIEKSQKNADNGVNVADEVAGQLNSIKQSAEKMGSLIGEIAAASKEQAQGIDQVNTGVSEMDRVVQQNAADAEESASASEELSSQASEMEKMVAELEAMVGASGKAISAVRGGSSSKQVQPQEKFRSTTRKISNGAGKKQAGAQRSDSRKADQVIPLDDDEFKDF
ncbi:methyl-accepting chemotaxis protein [Desulfosalsimonas propionicica]|uniref:Methyl-accepting chemotaxis protein n=1 Tax=Desulfosalsimonas propionicica TaxID=332175 RepID=A0A7W0C7B4_9BACT|nr:methyl-accepting chemotaxis protein [Desulfosalsimonas propionicica]MBA2880511.1 methyl-accepting chemotaxis protein [Desulfosalsimonas propionicica]